MSLFKLNYIAQLNNEKESWKIAARVIRLWNVSYATSPNVISSIQMVLLDEKGDKIQASIATDTLIKKYIDTISEGKCYIIQKFLVVDNIGDYKATRHKCKINFHKSTVVHTCDLQVPHHSFDFVAFEDILHGNAPKGYLVDVLGEISTFESSKSFQKNGRMSKFMNLYLADNSNNKIKCTLFGDYADYLTKTINESLDTTLIVVFQLAMISYTAGEVKLSNSWNASKFLINPDVPAVAEFKTSLNLNGQVSSQRYTQHDSHTQGSTTNDSLSLETLKTLSELKQLQNGVYTTLATIIKIQTQFNWYYDACSIHGSKINIIGEDLICKRCDGNPPMILPRFKIHVEVKDQHGAASSFVMFDNHAFQIIQLTANDLKKRLVQEGDDDGVPDELDCLLKKTYIFKVEVNDFNKRNPSSSFTVKKIFDDADLIKSYTPSLPKNSDITLEDYVNIDSQVVSKLTSIHNVVSKLTTIHNESEVADSASTLSPMAIGKMTPIKMVFESATPNTGNDICSSNIITPTKRSASTEDGDIRSVDMISSQYSSTKIMPKIKKEKD